jgi:hypothetical protein
LLPNPSLKRRLAKAARRGQRLSSNYKGFLVCQTNRLCGESRQRFTFVIQTPSSFCRANASASIGRKGCGLEELQPVIDAVVSGLRTLMKDARGGSIR